MIERAGDPLHSAPNPLWDSRRLWSLWEMLERHAWYFFAMAQLLERLHREIGLPPPNPLSPPGGIGIAGLAGLAGGGLGSPLQLALPPPSHKEITENQRANVADLLHLIDNTCKPIDVDISKEIGRAIDYVKLPYSEREKTTFFIEAVSHRIVDELYKQKFLHVKNDRATYYDNFNLFGEDITKKFPKAAEDIFHAGSCYSLEQYTACIFHLMRVMEHCVQRFDRKLRVSINVSAESWHQIMLHVHKQVEALPGGAKATKSQNTRKQRFASAASRLDHVRLTWRNDVMHPKATYDEKEAFEVLNSVGAFLKSIVSVV